MTKAFNDLVGAVNGQMSVLCLLDLTAAVDTMDHSLLLLQLECQFGLHGIVLSWFQAYLSGRTFHVTNNGCASFVVYIVCSVPQGSVLGPLLFIVYMADLVAVAQKHNVTVIVHAFAGNTQMYLHCRRDDTTSAAVPLERCITDVGQWMSTNHLKLNTDKTRPSCCGSK